MHTQDYEDLLALENVVGVDVDEETGEVVVFVTEKVPEDDLPHDQIVANNADEPTDVIETGGEIRAEPATTPADHQAKHRPLVGGVSEGPASKRSAGTCGELALVTDADNGHWAPSVEEGDLVRLSNNHVYAGSAHEPGQYGGSIRQPARLDGGGPEDNVGEVVGYVPLGDGVTVDVAARTTTGKDTRGFLGLDDHYGEEVLRDGYPGLKGETGTKPGRTTAVTEGDALATSATVNVRMSDGPDDVVTFRDQLITEDMSAAGDSGSAKFLLDGTLAGRLFAGSDSVTVFNKAVNIEEELGVDLAPSEETPGSPSRNILSVGRGDSSPRSFAFSFDISSDSDLKVLGPGKSTEVVGQRINAYVGRWSNRYRIGGDIVEASIPDHAHVTLNGRPIDPSEVVNRL